MKTLDRALPQRIGPAFPLIRSMAAAVIALAVAIGTLLAVDVHPASANTPSDYSQTIYVGGGWGYQGLPITVGVTQDHAWVIASWAAVITAGAGKIADAACSETGASRLCDQIVSAVVAQLVNGQPRLTNHGLWVAIYVWGGPIRTTQGTW